MSNMNNFLVLMCGIALLSTPLHVAGIGDEESEINRKGSTATYSSEQSSSTAPTMNFMDISEVSPLKSTKSPLPVSHSKSPSAPVTTTPRVFTFKELRTAYLVAGGLILLSFLLLISTLVLAYKVCRLNRRMRELSSDTDLVVATEFQGVKGKPEKDVEETTVLMSDLSQTKEEMGNGTTKEEGENKTEDGDKNKGEGDAATPAAAAESSSPSKGPEETSESPSADATAASNSEGPKEPKDVV